MLIIIVWILFFIFYFIHSNSMIICYVKEKNVHRSTKGVNASPCHEYILSFMGLIVSIKLLKYDSLIWHYYGISDCVFV